MAINDTGAGLLAVAAGTVGAKIVYPSTDYVFDGHKRLALPRVRHAAPALGVRALQAGR